VQVTAIVFDGFSTHTSIVERMCLDGYKSYLGPVLIYDPVHSLALLWRLLVNKNVFINKTTFLNKQELVNMFHEEKKSFRKNR